MTRFLKKIVIGITVLANASSNLVTSPSLACDGATGVAVITLVIDTDMYEVMDLDEVTNVNDACYESTVANNADDTVTITVPSSCLNDVTNNFGEAAWTSTDTLKVGFKAIGDTTNVLVEQVSLEFTCLFVDTKKVGAVLGTASLATNTLTAQTSTSEFSFELKFYDISDSQNPVLLGGSTTVASGTPIAASITPKEAANQPNGEAFDYSAGAYVFMPTKCEFGVGSANTDIVNDIENFVFDKSVTLFDDATGIFYAEANTDLASHISQMTAYAAGSWDVVFDSFVFHDEVSSTYAMLCEVNTCAQTDAGSVCQTFKNAIDGDSTAAPFWGFDGSLLA